MKVYISKYRNHWISPYTILEKVCFWEKDKDVFYNLEDDPNNKYQKWVNFLGPISKGLQKFLDFIHPKINYVKIDKWDTWNMDSTLAPIILPMLKQLRDIQHGSPIVDLEDVPEHMRTTETEEWEYQQCFDFYHESDLHGFNKYGYDILNRWEWVMGEMIWAFEQLCDEDHDAQFHTGVRDMKSVPCEWDENGKPTMFQSVKGPNDTSHFDIEGYQKHNERINNGLRLFGKYYRGLWD
jgi:hypothetical protein